MNELAGVEAIAMKPELEKWADADADGPQDFRSKQQLKKEAK